MIGAWSNKLNKINCHNWYFPMPNFLDESILMRHEATYLLETYHTKLWAVARKRDSYSLAIILLNSYHVFPCFIYICLDGECSLRKVTEYRENSFHNIGRNNLQWSSGCNDEKSIQDILCWVATSKYHWLHVTHSLESSTNRKLFNLHCQQIVEPLLHRYKSNIYHPQCRRLAIYL